MDTSKKNSPDHDSFDWSTIPDDDWNVQQPKRKRKQLNTYEDDEDDDNFDDSELIEYSKESGKINILFFILIHKFIKSKNPNTNSNYNLRLLTTLF